MFEQFCPRLWSVIALSFWHRSAHGVVVLGNKMNTYCVSTGGSLTKCFSEGGGKHLLILVYSEDEKKNNTKTANKYSIRLSVYIKYK